MTLDEVLQTLPPHWSFNVGHTPHFYRSDSVPKQLRKRPFCAWVTNAALFGTKTYISVDADAATPAEALQLAIKKGLERQAELEKELRTR